MAPEETERVHSFRSRGATVRETIAAYLNKPSSSPSDQEGDAHDGGTPAHGGTGGVQDTTKEALALQTVPPTDEEDGWASDRSNGDQASSSTVHPIASAPAVDRRKRSKSPKQKNVPNISGRRVRRHGSVRGGLIGHAEDFITHSHTPSAETAVEEDNERDRFPPSGGAYPSLLDTTHDLGNTGGSSQPGTGESSRHGTGSSSRPGTGSSSRPGTGSSSRPGTGSNSRPSTGSSSRPGTGTGSIRNSRIEQILALSSLREASPTRSVRFVDDGDKSGASTPRRSTYQSDSPGTPTEIEGDEALSKGKDTLDSAEPGEHS